MVPLSRLAPQKCGRVVSIASGHASERLFDLGLTPGTLIRLVRSAPFGGPIEIEVRGSTLAIGREIAKQVLVRGEGKSCGRL